MIVANHRIAGITFRTEATVRLPRLQEEPYERFRVGDDVPPDVRHRIHKIAIDSLTLDPLGEEEQESLYRRTYLGPEELESPLLRAPAVRARVRAVQDRPAQMGARVEQDCVIVYDFAHHVLDFYYTEAYGGEADDRGSAERLRVSDNNPIAELFQVHEIKPDSLTAPPLTAEERAHLVRIAEFSPQVIPKLPLLLSPAVRARLQPGLDESEKMQVFIYRDGLTIWSLTHNTIDYFYPEGGGRARSDPEGRVAVNFPQMFATFLPRFSATMVHSSGVVQNQQAALFLAPDAGGKSTVLEHSTEGLLLNDDQIILRQEGKRIVAHATPLGRMTSGPCQAPLGAFFVLEKAPHFELSPVKPAELVKFLWDEHRVYTSILPKHLKIRAFELFCDVCTRVPAYRMRFPKDYVDWDAIDAAMER